MKKWIAFLSVLVLLFSFSACGKGDKGKDAEPSTELVTEAPTKGRIGEKDSFYVYIPEDWCKMEYATDGQKIRLFNTPSASDIQDDTEEIMIEMGTTPMESFDNEFKVLSDRATAHEEKKTTIDGYEFRCVYFTHPEGRRYTIYMGLVDGHLTTITLKGIMHTDETAKKVVESISFK